MCPWRNFSISSDNTLLSWETAMQKHGDVFFLLYTLFPKSYACEEQGDVFFCYALIMLWHLSRKTGWIQSAYYLYRLVALRPRAIRPRAQGRGAHGREAIYPIFRDHAITFILREYVKKRHPHVQRYVSFIMNPEAKCRGHVLNSMWRHCEERSEVGFSREIPGSKTRLVYRWPPLPWGQRRYGY